MLHIAVVELCLILGQSCGAVCHRHRAVLGFTSRPLTLEHEVASMNAKVLVMCLNNSRPFVALFDAKQVLSGHIALHHPFVRFS